MESKTKIDLNIPDDELVKRIYIASPCDVPWDSMEGDECKRFCGQCSLNVYNTSVMSKKQIADLIRESDGKACMKLYRRFDGTVITDDCPVGLRTVRDRIKKVACSIIAMLVWVGLISSAQAQGLVGAPVDVRFGVPASFPSPPKNPIPNYHILEIATFASCLILASGLFLKRGRVALLAAMLLGIWAFAGFAIGICYR